MSRRPPTKTTTRELAAAWKEQIDAGIKYRERVAESRRWNEFREYYRGNWNDSIVPVNLIFSYGRALIPRVYFNYPRVAVTATHPDYVQAATVVEAIDNWLIRELRLKQTIKSACLDAFICGTGAIKIGFDSEFGFSQDKAISPGGETATQEGTHQARRIEYRTYVRPGMPWAIRSAPDDVIVPFGYKCAEDMPWIAHRILRPLEDVRNDQKYSNTENISGTRYYETSSDRNKTIFQRESQIVYAELFEVRDFRTGRIMVFCEGETLMNEVDEFQFGPNGRIIQPWEFIQFNEDPFHFWGIPDIKMVLAQQLELNEARTQAQRHRAIALLKFIAARGSISETEIVKFLSGEVGPVVFADTDSVANAITTLQPHVPPDLELAAATAKNDIREILGFDYNQAAMLKPGTPPTATESAAVAESFNVRASERKDIVADALAGIVNKINHLIFRFWDDERVIQIVGEEGVPMWVKFRGDELAGDYRISIDPESGFPPSHALRMQTADKLLGAFGGDQTVNQTLLRETVLRQYEWLFPGITSILNTAMQGPMAQGLAAARQPAPVGTGMNLPVGNRGGGRSGSSPENPLEFQRFMESIEKRNR